MDITLKWPILCMVGFLAICQAEIKLVHTLMRHSNRNPFNGDVVAPYYIKDPHINNPWHPEGPAKVNRKGKIHAFKIGQFFREKYGKLLQENYTESNTLFRTGETSRLIETAHLVADGLFSPINSVWNDTTPRIPIHLDIRVMSQDRLLYAHTFCQNYGLEKAEARKAVNKSLLSSPKIEEFYQFVSHHTGVKYNSSTQAWILYHFLYSQDNAGYPLEAWTKSVFPHGQVKDLANSEYAYQTFSVKMKRLMGGVHIREFLDNVNRHLKREDSRQVFFYIAQEIQVTALLNTLGVFDHNIPGYASFITFELHEIGKEFFVKVLYRNGDTPKEHPYDIQPVDLVVPGCASSMCPLSTFVNVLSNVTPEDPVKECGDRMELSLVP